MQDRQHRQISKGSSMAQMTAAIKPVSAVPFHEIRICPPVNAYSNFRGQIVGVGVAGGTFNAPTLGNFAWFPVGKYRDTTSSEQPARRTEERRKYMALLGAITFASLAAMVIAIVVSLFEPGAVPFWVMTGSAAIAFVALAIGKRILNANSS